MIIKKKKKKIFNWSTTTTIEAANHDVSTNDKWIITPIQRRQSEIAKSSLNKSNNLILDLSDINTTSNSLNNSLKLTIDDDTFKQHKRKKSGSIIFNTNKSNK